MKATILAETLRDVGLFGGLNDEAVEILANAHEILDVKKGALVFREGEPGREMFVVLEGALHLTKRVLPTSDAPSEAPANASATSVLVAAVTKNDWFGEMSILDILPRPTTAETIAPCRLLKLTAHDLDVLYRKDSRAYTLLVLNIAREMSRRLRLSDQVIAEMRGTFAK